MKIGMPTLMEFNTVKENLEVAKELGLDFLELNINMLYCTPDEEFRKMLVKYRAKYEIDFTMHYYDTVDVSSTSRHYRNYLYTAFQEIVFLLLILYVFRGDLVRLFLLYTY